MPAPVHHCAPHGPDLRYSILDGFRRPYPTTHVYSSVVLSCKKCARLAHRPLRCCPTTAPITPTQRTGRVGRGDKALFNVPGSRVTMRTPSRADDAMGWLPRAAPGSGEAIGAVPRSRSPCRRPGWGSQVVGLRSGHARRFRRRWCNWGHNAQVPGPCGGPRKRARGDGAPDATRFKLWWGGCRSAPPATFELGTAGGVQSFT